MRMRVCDISPRSPSAGLLIFYLLAVIPFFQAGPPHYRPHSLPTPAPYHPVLTVSQIPALQADTWLPAQHLLTAMRTRSMLRHVCAAFLHAACVVSFLHDSAINDASFQDHTVSFPTSATPPLLSG
ncbi:hypothetical protein B0H14DRAFT_427906 [Mycena olivaceomarginata]|nr:hypothetical protein B0H14DRAFT_427906 [Mycena olivaceomarginata]